MAATNLYALILGVSSGFGKAAAIALAKDGINIIGVHLDRAAGMQQVDELKEQLREIGVRQLFFNVNAADPERRADIMRGIEEEFAAYPGSTIRLMLHSLAFGTLKPFIADKPGDAISQKNLEMTMDVMANSIIYYTQDVVRHGLMAPGGRVIGPIS